MNCSYAHPIINSLVIFLYGHINDYLNIYILDIIDNCLSPTFLWFSSPLGIHNAQNR